MNDDELRRLMITDPTFLTDEQARGVARWWARHSEGPQLARVAVGEKFGRAALAAEIRALMIGGALLGPLLRWSLYGAPDSPGHAVRVLRVDITMSWDGDPWGDGLMALGGLCDVLTHVGEGARIPETADYFPGVLGLDLSEYPASEFLDSLRAGVIDVEAMGYFARVLDRYLDLVPADRRY
jgi:hypothetical protein